MNNPKDPSKRRKFGQACTICRRKKVKCDSKKPTCSNCLRLGNECEYLPLAKKRNPQKEYIVELEKKIELMEALLKTTRKNNHQDTLDVLSHIGTSNDQIAADDLSMLRAKSMQELCFGYGPDVMDSPSWFPADSSSDLSLEESKILVDTYFKKVNNTIEIIHRPTFMKDFEKNRVAKPLLYAMYAVTLCTYCDEITPTHSSKFTNGNLYARKAKELLSAASQLDVSTIQALIIMTCFQFGHSPTSWIFPALAIRIAQALGINRVDENYTNEMLSPEQWIDRETKRRIWWMCYVLDRYGASVTRRPLMIDERDCHVLLPAAATAWENGIQTPSYMLPIEEMDEDKMDVSFHPTPPYTNISCSISAVCVELFTIWGKITRYVNRLKVKKWARSNHKPCPQFVALDAELQTWAISLPPQYQYTSPKACNEERYKAYLDVRELNIMYHTCTIILHRINLHNSNTNQVTPAPSFRVLSSLKRCYTAANAISHIIGDVTPIDFGYFNGFLPFCIFTASTVYLSSIISIPWDQVIAETDVALLYWTLQSLSKTMPVSEKYCHILQLLHERPGVTSPSFKVDSVNKMEPALMENTTTCNELFSESQNFAPFGNAFLPSPFSFSTFNPQHVNINYNMGSEIQKTNMVDNSGDLGVTHNTVPQRTLPEGQGAVKWFKLVPKMTFEPHIPHTTDTFRAEQAINTNSNAFGFIQ